MKRLSFLILLVGLTACVFAQELTVLTEDWAPFDYLVNGKPAGLAVEMVQALLTDAGFTAPIQIQPWNRAYDTALNAPNVLLFCTARRPDREALFNWIFQIAPREMWLMKLAERTDIVIPNLDAAKKYSIASGPQQDASTQDLVKAGFVVGKNLFPINQENPDNVTLQQLFMKRIDLLIGNPISIAYAAKTLGLDFSKVNLAFMQTSSTGYWLVLSLKSDPATKKKLMDSAAKLEKNGTFKTILAKYMK